MTTNRNDHLSTKIRSIFDLSARSNVAPIVLLFLIVAISPLQSGCSADAVGHVDPQQAEQEFTAALDGAIADDNLEPVQGEVGQPYAAHSAAGSKLVFIPPGTKVSPQDRTVDGFTHLVVFSRSQFTSAARKKVEAITAKLASSMFTVFAADVSNGGEAHRLDRVACGVGTLVDGGSPIILTEATCSKLGVSLGFLHRRALSTTEEYVGKTKLLGRTETMQLIDSPIVMSVGGRNRDVLFRYAIMVHPDDGRLATLCWALTPGGSEHSGPVSPVHLMSANYVNESQLTVDSSQYTFGIPNSLTYGLLAPPGQPTAEAGSLDSMIARSKTVTTEQLKQIEPELRKLAFP